MVQLNIIKQKKKIEKKFGNFFSGEYGNYSTQVNYNDKNIVYTRHTDRSELFISAAKEEYNKFIHNKINWCKK